MNYYTVRGGYFGDDGSSMYLVLNGIWT